MMIIKHPPLKMKTKKKKHFINQCQALCKSYHPLWSVQRISSCYRMVPSAIWEIFSEFFIFCNLFHEPLGE